MFTSTPSSLCILRLSAIGDVCNTIATVQAIQKQWPEAHITWITGKLEAQLLQAIDDVEVIVFDKKQDLMATNHCGSNSKDASSMLCFICNMPFERAWRR